MAVGAGVGGAVLYSESDVEAVIHAQPPAVVAAAESALGEMDVVILGQSSSELDGVLTARTAQDKKVTIKVKRQTDKTSTVSIRVGTFGNEPLSRNILDRMKKRLEGE